MIAVPQLPPGIPFRTLRQRFEQHGWTSVGNVIPAASAAAMSQAVAARRFECRVAHPRALAGGAPSFMFSEERLRPHRSCQRACAPLCNLGRWLTGSSLSDFVRALADAPDLAPRALHVRAYMKGSHVERGLSSRRGIEILCPVTANWDAARGGELRFGEGEPVCPCFGTLYIVEQRPDRAFSVALVHDHGPLALVSAWME